MEVHKKSLAIGILAILSVLSTQVGHSLSIYQANFGSNYPCTNSGNLCNTHNGCDPDTCIDMDWNNDYCIDDFSTFMGNCDCSSCTSCDTNSGQTDWDGCFSEAGAPCYQWGNSECCGYFTDSNSDQYDLRYSLLCYDGTCSGIEVACWDSGSETEYTMFTADRGRCGATPCASDSSNDCEWTVTDDCCDCPDTLYLSGGN